MATRNEPRTVGRQPPADVIGPDLRLAREHARFLREGDRWFVERVNASGDILVNDEVIRGRAAVKPGDTIALLPSLVFEVIDESKNGRFSDRPVPRSPDPPTT